MKSLLSALLFSVLLSPAFAATYNEGIHYESIQPQPSQGKVEDKVEVIEFFMYGCPHCFNFEPTMQAWNKTKSADVEFIRIPALFGSYTNMHAKVFFALEAMSESERVHQAFFNEVHVKKNRLKTLAAVEVFLKSQGVDMQNFSSSMGSFAVAAKTNRAKTLLARYQIKGVPSLVIDGRYKNASGLRFKEMVEMVDQVVEQVRQDRKTTKE